MTRRDSGFAAYVQAACNCWRGYMCLFCRRWLAPQTPPDITVRIEPSEPKGRIHAPTSQTRRTRT